MPRSDRTAAGIRPRLADAIMYERALRRLIINPYTARIAQAVQSAGSSYEAARDAIRAIPLDPVAKALSGEAAERYMRHLKQHHIERWEKTMRRWLGVEVRHMSDTVYGPIMRQAIEDNVGLIVTIPQRLHQGLIDDLTELSASAPYDQAKVREVLATRYRSTGYDLRRLTRDQTSKAIGRFTQARHAQAGIERYQWVTAGDARVRPSHRRKDGLIFAWVSPPPDTGHPGEDIQCRCYPSPIIPRAGR